MLREMLASLILIGLVGATASAAPSRIVILRGGEVADAWRLCETGKQRAQALRYNYLGAKAANSLFPADAPPAYFFAMTLPGAALTTPASRSWRKPIIFYPVLPEGDEKKMTEALHARTREAARNVLNNPALKGKTVVMVWERTHIADRVLDDKYQREAAVTLRQLLRLDILPGVPRDWPADNHDYFWIVDFPDNSNVPSKFEMVKQEFGQSFPGVPANDWGEPSGLDANSGCRPAD